MPAASFYLLLFCLIYSPLAFGSVDLLPRTISQAAAFAGLLLFIVHSLRNKLAFQKLPGLLPLSLLFAFILLQTVPLPPQLLKIIAPASFSLHADAAGSMADPGWRPISINLRATFSQFFHFAGFAAIYLLAALHCADKGKCRQVLWVLVSTGALVAFLGLAQKATGARHMLWLRLPPAGCMDFIGPFAYRDQYAAYLEMLAPLALALSFHYMPKIKSRESLRQRLLAVFNDPASNRHFLLGFAAVLCVAAVFVSKSRNGILAVSLSCLLATIFIGRQGDKKAVASLLTAIFFCMSLLVGWIGWDVIVARFDVHSEWLTKDISDGRMEFWRQSLPMLRDFLGTGAGLGSFGRLFPAFATFKPTGQPFLYHLHNDYLEVLSDLGLIGFLLLGWFLFEVARSAFSGFKERRDSLARCLFLAAGADVLAQLLHLTVEYNLQSGAVGITFFTMLALLVSGGHTRFRSNRGGSTLPDLPPASARRQRLALSLAGGFLLFGSLYWNGSYLAADSIAPGDITWNRDTPREELAAIANASARARSLMPLHSYYHYLLADTARLSGMPEQAKAHYLDAIRLNPAQPAYLQDYGFFLASQGKTELADHYLATAVKRDRANVRRYEKYANWLLEIGNQQKALQVFGQALAIDPAASKRILSALIEAGFVRETLRQILPDRAQPYLALASLTAPDDAKEAEILYLRALELTAGEPKIMPGFFIEPYKFYKAREMQEEAISMLRRGTELLPEDVSLRLALAGMYEEQGIDYRAEQEYRQILVIDPKNKKAKEKLAQPR